ncbi:TetR family transcriptional regulator [Hutsoniella sourekii]|uniref:TetR family transcriptional regulator n=1 Tax=Hutsoniella sourekii TaxID=87650 RepID=UPI0004BC8235|nr:TetR family transcriptional regulator [Hutsoniella sourekii]
MPTQTFFNLAEDKKTRLLAVARHEFEQVPFWEASIARIVRQADISRGSFYQYFANLEDLYFYLIFLEKDRFMKHHLASIDWQDASSLLKSMKTFTGDYLKFIYQPDQVAFFKQVYLSMDHHALVEFDQYLQRCLDLRPSQTWLQLEKSQASPKIRFLVETIHRTISDGFLLGLSQSDCHLEICQRLDWLFYGLDY